VSATSFSTAHIAALQRSELDEMSLVSLSSLNAQVVKPADVVCVASVPRQDSLASQAARLQMMGDTLAGLGESPNSDHLVFVTSGHGGESSVGFAIADSSGKATPATNLRALLCANFPGIVLADESIECLLARQLTKSAVVVGSPSPSWPEAPDDPGPLDRLVAGLRDIGKDAYWIWSVVAHRLAWNATSQKLSLILAELRSVANEERGSQPVAEYYRELLEAVANKLTLGRSVGLWSVTSVLAASSDVLLARACSLAQSVFSGVGSKPDPIRVLRISEIPLLPARFDAAPPSSPGPAIWPGAYSSLLHSHELSAMVGIPRLERAGFEVRRAPRFKQSIPSFGPAGLVLGAVLDRGALSGPSYAIDPAHLTSHVLIAGTSGSGKTNTVFHILRELSRQGIPFLVIEPTKTEYRSLLDDSEIGPELVVYTLGQEMVAPFRLNPFEVPNGILIQTHLDRLKALFNASFTMYAPMPQVLERCLTEIYEDRGWDLTTNENHRGSGVDAFPTLGDLYLKIEEIVPLLGYEEKITSDVSAALRTRIDSLRIGAKGLMLDTTTTADIGTLLERPTVLEVEAIGDDDEKAFLVGLIFMRLAEAKMLAGSSNGKLTHLTVIEEAHRLFMNVPLVAGSEVGNPKGKAVETFCNILSEIRAYGEGIVVVDQIPTRLAPDTIKNSNLKVMHRLPASEDREVLGRSMAQNSEEIEAGVALPVGVALVYSGGQSGSFEILIPKSANLGIAITKDESDRHVKEAMASRCPSGHASAGGTTVSVRQVQALQRVHDVQEQALRWIQSVAVSPGPALDVLLPLVQAVARYSARNARAPVTVTLLNVLRASLRACGNEAGWSFDSLDALETALVSAFNKIFDCLTNGKTPPDDATTIFREEWSRNSAVTLYPFPQCDSICPAFLCRYRHAAKNIAERAPLRSAWVNALKNNTNQELWRALSNVADRAVERGLSGSVTTEHRRRFAGCFTLHSLDQDRELEQTLRAKVITNVMKDVDMRIAAAATQPKADTST